MFQKGTCSSSFAPMGVAGYALGKTSCGLRRALLRKDVPRSGRLSFKVDGRLSCHKCPTENDQDGDTSALSSADVVNAPAEERSALENRQSLDLTVSETETKQPTNLRRSARERCSPAHLKDYVS